LEYEKECTGHTVRVQVFTNALTEKILRQNWLHESLCCLPRPTSLSNNGTSKTCIKELQSRRAASV
jgi:hypothetical protein